MSTYAMDHKYSSIFIGHILHLVLHVTLPFLVGQHYGDSRIWFDLEIIVIVLTS